MENQLVSCVLRPPRKKCTFDTSSTRLVMMKAALLFGLSFVCLNLSHAQQSKHQVSHSKPGRDFHAGAPTPPMGGNSWDCFGPTVTEAEVKANADYMAEHGKQVGCGVVGADEQREGACG